jgi:GT2 family glycosyltransferase
MKLSICIVNFNAKGYLRKCLESIYANSSKENFEIIVIDNASSDGSHEMIEQNFKKVRLIKNSENLGFAKANNQALKASNGEYLFVLNNDTIVSNNALDILIKFMDEHPEAGTCGPLILNSDDTMQRQCKRGFPTFWNSFAYYSGLWKLFLENQWWRKNFGGYFLLNKPDEQICEVDCLSGAAMMVKRELLEKVGLMCEDYIMYWDDIDWCYRIKKVGWKIYYVPLAKIIHFGGAGGSQLHAFKNLWYFHRGACLFYRRYLAPHYFFLINLLYYSGVWFAFSLKLLLNLFRKEKVIGSKKPS